MRADTEVPKKLYEVRPASNRGQTIIAIVNLGSPTVWPQFLFVRGSMWDPYLPETIAVEAQISQSTSRLPGSPQSHRFFKFPSPAD